MKILIISDVHGNLSALDAVLLDAGKKFEIDYLAVLGDLIDYGMRSNEVIERMKGIEIPLLCNIWGNHEDAIMNGDYSHFSSQRGRSCAGYTKSTLSQDSAAYLNKMEGKNGKTEFIVDGKRFLAVHGSIKDTMWNPISPDGEYNGYSEYDYILSGHSHIPHMFPVFYSSDNEEYRNKKRTVFINPGSVGQPRNHDRRAQYAVLDLSGDVFLCGTGYDIEYEQSLYTDEIDPFYRDRLSRGV